MTSAKTLRHFQAIWHVTRLIPEGYVAGYKLVADLAGLPGRARMIGRALAAAPEHEPVPWHRVLRSNGQIAFPAGSEAAHTQRERLLTEGVTVNNQRVNMAIYGWQPPLATLLHELNF